MNPHNTFEWAVIGAGPAGIATIGNLIDRGISGDKIAWFDPAFSVGDFGGLWRHVSSNTKVVLFLKFLHACSAFQYKNCQQDFEINHADPSKTCQLDLMAKPLQWVSDQLCQKVNIFYQQVESLDLYGRHWQLECQEGLYFAKNTVLAVGATPKTLPYHGPKMIPLEDAMDSKRLENYLSKDDTVAVFGSSHSAILALRELVEHGVKRIINFYRVPLRYAVDMGDWILFDDTGLKGATAAWARDNIDGSMPAALERYLSSEDNVSQYLPGCNKVVYAVGFEKRTRPVLKNAGEIQYNDKSGIIAPGLFGVGIAYPEGKVNPIGILEYRVGLWKFMDYISRVIPIWSRYET